ncbi:gamma-mobile-trio protein GmtX, partial [Paraburkholderia xenovorans]|uniref:gamma-mobile-trio protein GmtX n=1 Tax=Paraburkholderia xenovorans TaxID=36873 RepID=UPI0038B8A5A0
MAGEKKWTVLWRIVWRSMRSSAGNESSLSAARRCLARNAPVCRKQYEAGSRDFSLPAIGRQAEAESIMKGRALYNAQSADY